MQSDYTRRFWATVCKTVRPMLWDRCLSVLSVCDVGVLWPNGWTDQDETWHAGRPRPWPHCVRWGPTSPPLKGHSPQFSAHICCGQMAAWIKMPLSMEIGLCPSHFVLDWFPAIGERGTAASLFSVHAYCGHGRPSVELFFDHATHRSRQKRNKTLRHLGQDSSALRSELSLGQFSTSADLSGPTKLVPKCPGSEVSWVRSVRNSNQKPNKNGRISMIY